MIRYRGISKRLIQPVYRAMSSLVERMHGVNFSRIESQEVLGLDKGTSEFYESSKLIELRRLFSRISLPANCRAIDFGSGKGLVVWYLSTLPEVRRVVGIEISSRLANISGHNLARLGVQNVDILNIDAKFVPDNIVDGSSLFYFYNPFRRETFEQVFRKIEESVVRRCREVILVYFNPVYGEVVDSSDLLMNLEEFSNLISNARTVVYTLGSKELWTQ